MSYSEKIKIKTKINGTGGQHRLSWPRSRARHGTAAEKVRIKKGASSYHYDDDDERDGDGREGAKAKKRE